MNMTVQANMLVIRDIYVYYVKQDHIQLYTYKHASYMKYVCLM